MSDRIVPRNELSTRFALFFPINPRIAIYSSGYYRKSFSVGYQRVALAQGRDYPRVRRRHQRPSQLLRHIPALQSHRVLAMGGHDLLVVLVLSGHFFGLGALDGGLVDVLYPNDHDKIANLDECGLVLECGVAIEEAHVAGKLLHHAR